MNDTVILFGAGTTGRFVVRDMLTVGYEEICFADNDPKKQGTTIEGIRVSSPETCKRLYPDATWIATVMHEPEMSEILEQIKALEVKTQSFWDFIPNRDSKIPGDAFATIVNLAGDAETVLELYDQMKFREHHDHTNQLTPYPLEDLYFPEFYTRLEHEHFVDCGACEGDTIVEFKKRWPNYAYISAFEPDRNNFINLQNNHYGSKCYTEYAAVSDFEGQMAFTATGDMSAHLGGVGDKVPVVKLDTYFPVCEPRPTFIKADIEGAELEMLWGARRIIKEHKPVIAICAYHTADHLWEIPLLIHALQPEYKLFLRHYRPGTYETVWYAVPPHRMVK